MHWNHFGPAEIFESKAATETVSYDPENQVVRCGSEELQSLYALLYWEKRG